MWTSATLIPAHTQLARANPAAYVRYVSTSSYVMWTRRIPRGPSGIPDPSIPPKRYRRRYVAWLWISARQVRLDEQQERQQIAALILVLALTVSASAIIVASVSVPRTTQSDRTASQVPAGSRIRCSTFHLYGCETAAVNNVEYAQVSSCLVQRYRLEYMLDGCGIHPINMSKLGDYRIIPCRYQNKFV